MSKHERPWGYYEILAEGPGYLVKRITVLPGQRTSLQWHEKRRELWQIVKGDRAVFTFKRPQFGWYEPGIEYREWPFVDKGDQFKIDPKELHRIENNGTEDLVLIEVQTGICDEADVHRIEDDYGRPVEGEES